MSWYADAHLSMSEPDDYGEKECPRCEGVGELDGEDCPECDGFGIVEKDLDDAIDEEWDAKCED